MLAKRFVSSFNLSFNCLISSLVSGDPWTLFVPCKRESLPIIVLISINDGLSVLLLAFDIAISIKIGLLPSATKSVCHPIASNLLSTSSSNVLLASASNVTPLESYKTIRFPSFKFPASEQAS